MYLRSLLCSGALTCTGFAAQAGTIILDDYLGIGEPIEDAVFQIDLVGGGPALSQPDGMGDLFLSDGAGIGEMYVRDDSFFGAFESGIYQIGGFAYDSETDDLMMFEDGDTVGFSDDYYYATGPALLYDGSGGGALPNMGDSGVFGFVMDFVGTDVPSFGPRLAAFDDDDDDFDDDCDEDDEDERDDDCYYEEEVVFYSYFGWVQVEHGSVIPGLIGISDTSFEGALVSLPPGPPTGGTDDDDPAPSPTAIPLPAASWLLLAGLGGLAALGRRKS